MIKKHVKIAVDIPTTDKDNKLILEPGRGDIVILSDTSGLKVAVEIEMLREALFELQWMKRQHLPPETDVAPEPVIGEILEGDEE